MAQIDRGIFLMIIEGRFFSGPPADDANMRLEKAQVFYRPAEYSKGIQ